MILSVLAAKGVHRDDGGIPSRPVRIFWLIPELTERRPPEGEVISKLRYEDSVHGPSIWLLRQLSGPLRDPERIRDAGRIAGLRSVQAQICQYHERRYSLKGGFIIQSGGFHDVPGTRTINSGHFPTLWAEARSTVRIPSYHWDRQSGGGQKTDARELDAKCWRKAL